MRIFESGPTSALLLPYADHHTWQSPSGSALYCGRAALLTIKNPDEIQAIVSGDTDTLEQYVWPDTERQNTYYVNNALCSVALLGAKYQRPVFVESEMIDVSPDWLPT